MSVIRKTPYIENVLASMTDENLKDLRTILNSGGNNVSLSFTTLTADPYKGAITPAYFQFEDNGLKTGILIWTDTKCCLICYHKYQDLLLLELDPVAHTWKKVNEYCDINELRRVLDDTIEAKGVIDSGGAAANTILAADGNGGTSWKAPLTVIKDANTPEGNATYLLGLDSEGNVIKDELPEGIVVDQTVVEDSANAVAGGAVYDFVYSKTDVDTMLETKANVDGNYPTMTVGAADNLTPYDESAGADQDDPFSFQATGTGNGSQADFATGALALMKEKRGNSVAVNQLLNKDNYEDTKTSDGITWTKNADGSITISGALEETSAAYYLGRAGLDITLVNGHKYLVKFMQNEITGFDLRAFRTDGTTAYYTLGTKDNINTFEGATATWRPYFVITDSVSATAFTTPVTVMPLIIDLTQWFNGDIPADLLAHPENWYRYYQGSLAYNAGGIVNANSRYIKCIGRNQWDEEVELGAISSSTGENIPSSTTIRSKNYIKVIPNIDYLGFITSKDSNLYWYVAFYDKDKNFIYLRTRYSSSSNSYEDTKFTTPSNCCYVRFYVAETYGITYNHDITISIYYSGESGYDQYYPYEVLTNNDTGNEVLRSAGNAADSKIPDGTIHRVIDSVDLSNATLSGSYYKLLLPNVKIPSDNAHTITNYLTNSSYKMVSMNEIGNNYGEMAISSIGELLIYNDSQPSGILQFELATPTTEQGTPYSANLVIDDFGSMEFAGTSGVPQGNLIFYPVDYKAFIDTLYDYTQGTPSDLVKQSELSAEATARGNQDTILQNAIGGTLRQCLCVKETLDFDNTDFVDLGELNWTAEAITNCYAATITGMKVSTYTRQGVMSTKYPFSSVDELSNNMSDKSMLLYIGNNRVYIKDSSYSDATAFKAAMKGVLLAYEKAGE